MRERSVELEEKGNQQFKRYCPGCKHCVIPKRLKEEIKWFMKDNRKRIQTDV